MASPGVEVIASSDTAPGQPRHLNARQSHPEDREAVNRIIDGLLAKTRVHNALTKTA